MHEQEYHCIGYVRAHAGRYDLIPSEANVCEAEKIGVGSFFVAFVVGARVPVTETRELEQLLALFIAISEDAISGIE